MPTTRASPAACGSSPARSPPPATARRAWAAGPPLPRKSSAVSSTCSAPGRAGTQVTYLQGTSADLLKQYTEQLLLSAGGDRTNSKWKGNGLDGEYSSAAGKNSAELVFAVSDRPLAGFIYQVNSSEHAAVTTPGALADYFETSIQPGE
jgi:hypothetical protein